MRNAISVAAALGAAATGAALAWAGPAAAAPSGYSNAQDTVNSLQAQGFNVIINGATAYPLSSCKVTGIEGLNSSNIDSSGRRIDPKQFDTVYVDVFCRGG